MSTVTIDPRFVGPPHSANGGYACGLVATAADGPVAVSLRVPPPVGRPLDLVGDDHMVRLLDGDVVVGESARWTQGWPAVPATVSIPQAARAATRFHGLVEHPFPTCWTCGPDRDDGLGIFAGPVDGANAGLVAAPWVPGDEVDAGDGTVAAPHVWAALDCPSYYGCAVGESALLARLAADLRTPVRVGHPHVVLGWPATDPDGRKRFGASAILDADGAVLAVASALWVTLSETALAALLEPR